MRHTYKIVTVVFVCTLCLTVNLHTQEQPPGAMPGETTTHIDLNLKEVPIQNALKVISAASGLNAVLDQDVQANVTIVLKDVHWRVALDSLLKTHGFTYAIQDNIIRVMTVTTKEKEKAAMQPLSTEVMRLNFAEADTLQGSLKTILSERGSIQTNVPTNALIITDTPEKLVEVQAMAKKLDIRTPQVMIEALIMSVKLEDDDRFGIDWTATHKERASRTAQQTLSPDLTDNLLQLTYGKTIFPKWNFTQTIQMYAEDKDTNILASPRILTLDNLAAQIEITEQVPYTFVSESTEGGSVSTTQFKDVGIKLYVTPHITKDEFISLKVKAEQSFVASFTSAGEPAIDSRKAETNFILRDGETVVIGGLRSKEKTVTTNKVPFLSDIPFIGRLFKKDVMVSENTELIIFITPHIIETTPLATIDDRKHQKSKEALDARSDFILRALDEMSEMTHK